MIDGRKQFFFEKKNQKTSGNEFLLVKPPRSRLTKVFLLLFFQKKKRLLFLALITVPNAAFAQTTSRLTQSETDFAFDLYGQIEKTPGNFFFSPYSVSTALGMLYAGARGSTAMEVAHTLHLKNLSVEHGTDLRTTFLQAVKQQPVGFGAVVDGAKLMSANALWSGESADLDPAYIATINTIFDGEIFKIDVSKPDAAARRIDNWVAVHTGDKILHLISSAQLNRQTRLVLTNAVYFQAGWADPFDAANTAPAPFHVTPGRDVDAPMMNQTHEFDYAAGNDARLISLDYRYGDASMIIILPNETNGLGAIEAAMTPDMLDRLLANASAQKIRLEMPKFDAESSFDLPPVLKSLGMRQAFDPMHADLTGIANEAAGRLFVSDVVHKAYVDVDEAGTVAAAATGITITTLAAPLPTPPIPFIADHPFLYLIRDNATGEILFMGRMTDPTQ
jgi:serpin B